MSSPYHYGISSFMISNISNPGESDNDLGNESINHENLSEISATDIVTDFSVIETDYEDHFLETSTSDNGDSFNHEDIHHVSDPFNETESDSDVLDDQVEDRSKRIKLCEEDKEADDTKSVDISEQCPICLGAWRSMGDHRLCALRCGHLFGYKCIKQWLNSDNERAKKCPQCNAKASIRHIRFLYANKLTSLDNSEIERMKKQLEEVRQRESEIEKALIKEKKKTKKYKQMYKTRLLAFTDSDVCLSD